MLTQYRAWRKRAGMPLAELLSAQDWSGLYDFAHRHATADGFKDIVLRLAVQQEVESVLDKALPRPP
jgi:hypothetical protein